MSVIHWFREQKMLKLLHSVHFADICFHDIGLGSSCNPAPPGYAFVLDSSTSINLTAYSTNKLLQKSCSYMTSRRSRATYVVSIDLLDLEKTYNRKPTMNAFNGGQR